MTNQTLGLAPSLYEYLLCVSLREETANHPITLSLLPIAERQTQAQKRQCCRRNSLTSSSEFPPAEIEYSNEKCKLYDIDAMESDSLPTEIILSKSARPLGKVRLDWHPQPGHYIEYKGKTYAVLERRHRYQFKFGRYRLHNVALYVQCARRPDEQSLVDGRWVVGDATCCYNAGSELLRCAINPEGPCQGCRYYQPRPESI